jgi:hypothetical protein
MSANDTEAAKAVGEQAADDWHLRPEKHADALPPAGGPLARVLRTPEVEGIVARYHDADARAIAQQVKYRRLGRVSIWARFMALAVGGIALLPLGQLNMFLPRSALIVAQGGAIIVSLLAALWVIQRAHFSNWMHARAAAEIARVDLFSRILDASSAVQPGELGLLPLKLEYFRRYQLDVECAFYRGRGAEHARAAGATMRWKLISLALVAVVTAAILYSLGIFGGSARWDDVTQKVAIAFMTLVSAVLALISDTSLMDMSERNAARYATTYANLSKLRAQFLEPVRAAAAQGDEAAVQAFTRIVNEQISSEHREWVYIHDLAPRPEMELLLRLPVVGRQLAGDAPAKR